VRYGPLILDGKTAAKASALIYPMGDGRIQIGVSAHGMALHVVLSDCEVVELRDFLIAITADPAKAAAAERIDDGSGA
jgi:hypothetical protein